MSRKNYFGGVPSSGGGPVRVHRRVPRSVGSLLIWGVVRGTLRQWLEAYGTGSWFGYLYLDATYLDVRRHGRPSPRPPSSRSVSLPSDGARSSACPSGTASRPTSGPSSSEACANAVSTPPELPGAS